MQESTMNNQNHNSIWRQAMYYVLFGLMLSSVSFNMLGLNYILPIIGLLLQWIGFRRLQYETAWFRACWIMTSLRIVIEAWSLCINATIWNAMLMQTEFRQVIVALNVVLSFGIVLCFWLGMRNIRYNLSKSVHNSAAGLYVIWYILLLLLAVLQLGSVFGLIMMILYFILFYRLFKLSTQIDDLGYQLENVVNIRAERWFAGFVSVVLVIGIAVGYLCFNQYPMQWSLISDDTKQAQINNEVYQHLKALGVDEYVLQDLSAEDLALCKDAIHVHVEKQSVVSNLKEKYEEDMLSLNLTHVAIELPSDNQYKKFRIIHHFQWNNPLDYHGVHGLRLWPTYIWDRDDWSKESEMTGQVLYDRFGKSYNAPYYKLYEDSYQTNTFYSGVQTSYNVFAEFDYPKDSEKCRGYVTYKTEQYISGDWINSWIHYAYQRGIMYPMKTAVDFMKSTSYGYNEKNFFYTQNALQIFNNEWESFINPK